MGQKTTVNAKTSGVVKFKGKEVSRVVSCYDRISFSSKSTSNIPSNKTYSQLNAGTNNEMKLCTVLHISVKALLKINGYNSVIGVKFSYSQ